MSALVEIFTDGACRWVKGHSGHPEDERTDRAANVANDEVLH